MVSTAFHHTNHPVSAEVLFLGDTVHTLYQAPNQAVPQSFVQFNKPRGYVLENCLAMLKSQRTHLVTETSFRPAFHFPYLAPPGECTKTFTQRWLVFRDNQGASHTAGYSLNITLTESL